MLNVYKSYEETLVNKGVRGSVVSFLVFSIFWLLGVVVGYVSIMLGIVIGKRRSKEADMIDEMVRKMNEMGPSN